MEYITKDELEEYIALLTNDEGKLYANDLLEYLTKIKFKQDLEVYRSQFGTITHFLEAERVSKLIELLGEVEQLWSDYFMPKDLIVNFNDSNQVLELQEVLERELTDFYKRELEAYNKNLKVKEHTIKPSKIIGLKLYEVAEDKY